MQLPEASQKWRVEITYLGQKNARSRSAEVWLLTVATPERPLDWHQVSKPPGWELRSHPLGVGGAALVNWSGPPRDVSMEVTGGTLSMQFLRHDWSGLARVTVNGHSRVIDLYSPVADTQTLTWQPQLASDVAAPAQALHAKISGYPGDSRTLRLAPVPAGRVHFRYVKFNGVPLSGSPAGVFRVPESYWSPKTLATAASLLGFFLVSTVLVLLGVICSRPGQASALLLRTAALLSALGISAFWVAVFFPAHMSNDSFDMWQQALEGRYHDWHPIGMTLVMRGVHVALASWPMQVQVAVAAFIQGTLLWIMIFTAFTFALRAALARVAVCAIAAFYYPMWPYTITLWKDVWFAIAFLGLLWWSAPLLTQGAFSWSRWGGTAAFLTLAFLTRSTAWLSFLFLAVVSMLVLAFTHRFHQARRVLVMSIAALFCAVGVQTVLYSALRVRNAGRLLDFYLAYDLVGTVHFTGKPASRFEHLQTYRVFGPERFKRAVDQYTCGVPIDYLVWSSDPPFNVSHLVSDSYAIQDMPLLVIGYPDAYLRHKGCSLAALLGVLGREIYSPYQRNLGPNSLGLTGQSLLPDVREAVMDGFLSRAVSRPGFLQMPYRHYVLLAVSAVAALLTILAARYLPVLDLLAIPRYYFAGGLAVLFPMLLTAPAADWRYMMPANLCWFSGGVVMVVCLFALFRAKRRTVPMRVKEEPRAPLADG